MLKNAALIVACLAAPGLCTAAAAPEKAPKEPPRAIEITVKDTLGTPIAGAEVVLQLYAQNEHEQPKDLAFSGTTGAGGKCRVILPREGGGVAIVRAEGYLETRQEADMFMPDRLDLLVERGGSLSGRLQDTRGKGYAGVPLMVVKSADDDTGPPKLVEMIPPRKTDANGEFLVPNLSSGFYTVLPDKGPDHPDTVEFEDETAPDIYVGEGKRASVVILVRPLGRLEGVIQFLDEVPNSVLVTPVPTDATLMDASWVGRRQSKLSTAGRQEASFSLQGLDSMGYRLEFEAEGYAPTLSQESVFLPQGGSVKAMPVIMEKGLRIEGIVQTDTDKKPISGASIFLFFPGIPKLPVLEARSGKDGSFAFGHVAPGKYTIKVLSSGLLEFNDGIEIAKDKKAESLTIGLKEGAVIEGAYVYADHGPVPGIHVVLVPQAKEDPATRVLSDVEDDKRKFEGAVTDAQGGFRFSGLKPGKYFLVFEEPGIEKEVEIATENEHQPLIVDGHAEKGPNP